MTTESPIRKVAMLTAGGLAPCLSSAVGGLIERYSEIDPTIEIIAYISGYQGLLRGESIVISPGMREKAGVLHRYGVAPSATAGSNSPMSKTA